MIKWQKHFTDKKRAKEFAKKMKKEGNYVELWEASWRRYDSLKGEAFHRLEWDVYVNTKGTTYNPALTYQIKI